MRPMTGGEPTAISRSETTRERIVVVTARHLAELGPRAIELKAVCAELGISPSLVNYYFASPAELLWTAAVYGYTEHVAAQLAAFDRARTGAAALEGWLRGTIEWTKANPGLAAVIDFPMLALSTEGMATTDQFTKDLSGLSRDNVTTLGSAVWALMKGQAPTRLSSARVAALIKLNGEFAYWISIVGFGGLGAAMWIAGRRPYGFLWRAFGFSPDRQMNSTIRELVARIAASGGRDLPELDEIPESPEGVDPD